MPSTLAKPYFNGPYRGINDLISPRQLREGDFVDALNVVNDGGSMRPRPGYVDKTSMQLLAAPTLFVREAITNGYNGIAAGNGYVFYSYDEAAVRRRDSSNADNETTIYGSLTDPRGLAYDADNDNLYLALHDGNFKIEKIAAASTGSPSTSTLLTGATTDFTDVAIDVTNDRIYATKTTAASSLWMATLSTGAGLAQVASNSGSSWVAVCVDPTGGKVYFADRDVGGASSIWRMDLDGTNEEEWITSGVGNIRGITVDSADGRIYWTDDNAKAIKSIKTDGTEQITYFSGSYGNITQINFDADTRMLYFIGIETGTDEIYQIPAISSVARVTSLFSLERSLVGVSGFADDWVIAQVFNESASRVEFVSWFPATGEAFGMPTGYVAPISTDPAVICTNNRDTGPAAAAGFQSKYGVADFAYTGTALNTAKGGVLIANGEGNGYFANYVMGNHKIRLTFDTVSSDCTLTVNGQTTGTLSQGTAEKTFRRQLLSELLGTVDQVIVDKTGSGAGEYFDIEFIGNLSGQAVTVTKTSGTGTTTLATTQTGGTETGHKIYLLPCGLPRPDVKYEGSSATHHISFDNVTTGSPSGNLTGIYEYCATFRSSILGIESPRSRISPLKRVTVGGSSQKILFNIYNAIPDTIYHKGSTSGIPFLLCDRLRVYRRRLGNDYSSGTTPDGQGQVDSDFRFVGEYDLQNQFEETLTYAIGEDDGTAATSTIAPRYDYPPEGAQYVEVHGSRAHWVPNEAGIQRAFYSEVPDPATGEFRGQCVRQSSFATLENTRASDHHVTSLKSFGPYLLLHTEHDAFLVNTDLLEFGTYQARRLPGAGGCAGKHCVVETEALPELSGSLVWPNGRGDIYRFNGSSVELLSQGITDLVRQVVRKTWQNIDNLETGQDNFYFASAALDPEKRRIIFSLFLDENAASNSPFQLVYHLDTGAWTRWDIPMWGINVIRELASGVGQGKTLTVFSDSSADLFTLEDGKGDDGSAFSWSMTGPVEDLGTLRGKNIPRATYAFEKIEYGATAAAVTFQHRFQTERKETDVAHSSKTLNAAGLIEMRLDGNNVRTVQATISGTQADDQDHPVLVGREIEVEMAGAL